MTSLPATAAASRHTDSDTLKILMTKPLFWTSVISLCISVVATTVLFALCVCRQRRPTAIRRPVPRRPLVHLATRSDNVQLPASSVAVARHNGMISITVLYCHMYRLMFMLIRYCYDEQRRIEHAKVKVDPAMCTCMYSFDHLVTGTVRRKY